MQAMQRSPINDFLQAVMLALAVALVVSSTAMAAVAALVFVNG